MIKKIQIIYINIHKSAFRVSLFIPQNIHMPYSSMYNVEKWPKLFLKSCGVNTAKFLRRVWPFFKIMHEMVKDQSYYHIETSQLTYSENQ